jgi:Family of unknown function (DUF6084)
MRVRDTPFAGPEAPPRLTFEIEGAEPVRFAAAPTVGFRARVEADKPVQAVTLNVQIRISPARRRYGRRDEERLVELFAEPARWGETLRSFLWANVTKLLPPFEGATAVGIEVPCTYDLEVASAKYFHGLTDGDAPLEFLFSGTMFYRGPGGRLQAAQIPWECEAEFRLPVRVWKETMEHHFPGSAWIRLRADVFDRLAAFKARHALPTWETTVEELLADE